MAKRKPKKVEKPKRVWVRVSSTRQKLVEVDSLPPEVRLIPARHSNKRLYSFGIHPSQVKAKNAELAAAGLNSLRFDEQGRCWSDNTRQADEYAYLQKQYVNLDGNHSIPTWRMRELDRIAGRG
jgi:hypothetical protein